MNAQSAIDLLTPVSFGVVAALVAVAVVAFLLVRWAAGAPIALARRWGLLALRTLVLITLLAILLNPVRVDESPGSVERPEVFYLIDASRSMALG